MSEHLYRQTLNEWFSHHHHDPGSNQAEHGGTVNNAGIYSKVAEGIGNIEGWTADLKANLPELAAKAALLDQSPIVAALEGVTLPPEGEQAIAALIGSLAAAHAAATGASMANAEPVAGEPARPEQPADAAA